MPSKSAPYLTLVWPPQGSAEDPDDCSSIQEQALRNDGWRSVSLDEMRSLPRGNLFVLHGLMLNGQMTFWLKRVPVGGPEPKLPAILSTP